MGSTLARTAATASHAASCHEDSDEEQPNSHSNRRNHRPAGAFSVDYCAYPVANMVEHGSDAAVPAGMHVDLAESSA